MMIASALADVEALATLTSIQWQLDDAVDRIAAASGRSVRLAEQTDWRTDAATAFGTGADRWRRDVAALSADVRLARDDVERACRRIGAGAAGFGM